MYRPALRRLPPGRAAARFALLCTGLFLSRAIGAAEPAPLSLDALLAEVERRNPGLGSRRAEIRAVAERPAQARAFEDPVLMAELWQTPVSLAQVPLMFTLRQPIPWPGKLRARAAALLPEITRARAESQSAARGLRLEATQAYYEYRLAIRAAGVLGQDRQLLATIVASVDVRYRVGKSGLAELLKAEEALASLDNTLLDVERQRELAVTTINTLLDRPADGPLGLPVTAPAAQLRPLPALPVLTEKALLQRPEVQAARAGIQKALAQVRAARAERAPDLMVWAGYMAMLRGGADNTFTAGVQTSIPSFSLSRTGAAAREAQAETTAQQAALAQVQARIRGEVRVAVLRLETAERHIRLHAQTLIPLSERTVQAAQAGFQSGRTELILLLEAARTLTEHRLEHERFQADYGQRWAELEAALGGPVEGPQGPGLEEAP